MQIFTNVHENQAVEASMLLVDFTFTASLPALRNAFGVANEGISHGVDLP